MLEAVGGKDKETLTITYKGRSIANYVRDVRFGHPNLAHQGGKTSKEHRTILWKQHTLSCHLPGHPNYFLLNQGLPQRNLKKYAAREYIENLESFIPRAGLNHANLKLSMKSIHTVDVRMAMNNNIKTKENWIPEMVFTMVEIVLSVRRNRESRSFNAVSGYHRTAI